MNQTKQAITGLYETDGSGLSWLESTVSRMRVRDYAAALPDSLGKLQSEPKFRYKLNPTREFLRWLIENSDAIVRHSAIERQHRAMATTQKRDQLFSGCEKTLKQALSAVKRFSASLKGEWWRFEGPIEVDCFLLTDTTVVAIDVVTSDEHEWTTNPRYPQRHYLLRSLDCASAFARLTNREHFFVGHVVEPDRVVEQHRVNTEQLLADSDVVEASLPHLTPPEREALVSHFLGATSLSEVFGNDAVERRQAS